MAAARKISYNPYIKKDDTNLSKYRLDLSQLARYMDSRPVIHHVINDLLTHLYTDRGQSLDNQQRTLIINTLKEINVLRLIEEDDEMQTQIKTESPASFFGIQNEIDHEINPGML